MHLPLPPSGHSKDKDARRRWREETLTRLRNLPFPREGLIEVVIDYYGPWLRDDGSPHPKKPDLKNLYGNLEDLIEKATGRNDRCHFRAVLTKHNSKREYCVVSLRSWRC